MRARVTFGTALALALAACHAPGPVDPARASARPAKPEATPATRQPETPAGTRTVTLLRTLPGPSVTLSGRVVVDARYAAGFGGGMLAVAEGKRVAVLGGGHLVGNAGGTLVGNAGGTLVGNAGGTLVGNAGGTFVEDAAGHVVAAGGGNVVVPAALVGTDGASLIGADGASLVGNAGGTLVGNAGGTLVGNAGGTYRLTAVDAAVDAAFGEGRPAVGMWLSVVDPRTGFTVPLGTDEAGKPVHTVYTDLSGGFKVQIPADAMAGRVVVRAPGLRDPKLVLNVVPKPGAEEIVVDAENAGATAFIRAIMRGRLMAYLAFSVSDDPDAAIVRATLAAAGFDEVQAAFDEIRSQLGEDRVDELGALLADAILADVDVHALKLSTLGVTPRDPAGASLAGRNVIEEVRGVLRRMQDAAVAQAAGATDPATFFATKPYLVAANLLRAPGARWRIDTPADLTNFIADVYLSGTTDRQTRKAFQVLEDLGLGTLDRDRLAMGSANLIEALIKALVGGSTEGPAPSTRLAALIRSTGARLAAAAPLPPAPHREAPPLPSPPALDEAVEVDTLPVTASGPDNLALDEGVSPPALYVSDDVEHAIRRITFDAAGAPTATLLTGAASGAIAHDGHGALYVCSSAGIVRISTRDADFGAVTPIAGAVGLQSGNAAALDPVSGDLFVADLNSHNLRRVALGQPGFPVSIAAGTALALSLEGPLSPTADHQGASFALLSSIAFASDGTLFASDAADGLFVVPGPLMPASRMRLLAGGGDHPEGVEYYHNAGLASSGGVAVRPDGRVVAVDADNHRVCLVTRDGWVHTLAGDGVAGMIDGPGARARFAGPRHVVAAKDGTIYVADHDGPAIRRIRPATP